MTWAKKWRVRPDFGEEIEEIEVLVEAETKCYIDVRLNWDERNIRFDGSERTRRVSKRQIFNAWEEAVEALILDAQKRIELAEGQLALEKKRLERRLALRDREE